MRRIRTAAVVLLLGLLAPHSLTANSWQGTLHYYDDNGQLVGEWTAGCGELDGSWGIKTQRWTHSRCGVVAW
jgi:hypothetical protein